jgi:hypothetical protein
VLHAIDLRADKEKRVAAFLLQPVDLLAARTGLESADATA